ncbi:MAG: hypothetical protein CL916_05015 [Deltaproteobacteria bacterium]|nr:hypothetical protein [Deltaproteobacteria bacterium]
MGRIVKWLSLSVVIGMLVLFVLQNMDRTPTIDTNGAYLSLDLYLWGVEQREPISLLWYFLGVFILGMCTSKLLSLRKG